LLVIASYILVILLLLFTKLVPADFNKDLHTAVIIYFIVRALIFLLLAFKGSRFRFKWRKSVLYAEYFLIVFLLLFNAVSEWFFWNEFSARYNFIAVDYLVYTNEVIGNIRESYPLGWIIGSILLVAIFIVAVAWKKINLTLEDGMTFRKRTVTALLLLLFPVLTFLYLNNKWDKISSNTYVNELAANGLFEFGEAFNANELDFFTFYKSMPDREAFAIMRKELASPNSSFTNNDPYSIERDIHYDEPERKLNVVLISVESLSAEYMHAFGNGKNITPGLDSLANESLFFTNLYASGTRTVRGLEALTHSIQTTTGQSIVKMPGNENK
jgi:phosphoglycerol transferase MdoB-like AlkP superfamily enzyme